MRYACVVGPFVSVGACVVGPFVSVGACVVGPFVSAGDGVGQTLQIGHSIGVLVGALAGELDLVGCFVGDRAPFLLRLPLLMCFGWCLGWCLGSCCFGWRSGFNTLVPMVRLTTSTHACTLWGSPAFLAISNLVAHSTRNLATSIAVISARMVRWWFGRGKSEWMYHLGWLRYQCVIVSTDP